MALSNDQIGELVKMGALSPSMGAGLSSAYGNPTGYTPEGAEVLNANTQYTPEGAEVLNPEGDPLPPGVHKGPGGQLVNDDGIPVGAPPIARFTGGTPVDNNGVPVYAYLPKGLANSGLISPDTATAAKLAEMPAGAAPVAASSVAGKPPSISVETTGFVPPNAMPGKAPIGVGGGPRKPMTIEDVMSKVYSPTQMAGFGLSAKQIKDEGARDAAMADVAAEKANHDAVLMQNAQSDAAEIQEQNALREEQRQQVIAKARESLETKWDELSKTEIDPDRYWNNKDTGEKVIAGIGVILAGIGGGLMGTGGNVALNAIESNINRDVEAQKVTFMQKGEGLKAKQSLFGQMMAEYGDERTADQATLATHWQQVSTQLQVIAAQSQNDIAKQNALDAKTFADNKVAMYTNGVEQNAEALWKKMNAPTGPSGLDKEFQKADMQHAFKIADELGGQVHPTSNGRFVVVKDGNIVWDGTKSAGGGSPVPIKQFGGLNGAGDPVYTYGGTSLNSKQAEKHNEAAKTLGALASLNAKAQKIHEEYGTELFGTDASKQASQLARDAEALGVKLPEKFNFTDVGNQWTTWKAAIDAKATEIGADLQTHEQGTENMPIASDKNHEGDEGDGEP